MTDTSPIRPGEEVDGESLARYLRGKLDLPDGRLTIEQFPGGHSNLTYLLKAGDREYVLRRPPLGPVPPKAHDMPREYRVLERIHPAFAAAPKVYLLCEDISVIGAPFFVMERRQGIIFRGRGRGQQTPPLEATRRISRAFMDCLVALHAVDLGSKNLHDLGKPEGFLERQVHGWSERWRRSRTDDAPGLDKTINWLAEHIPKSPAPALVHNDFKLDNLMLAGDLARVEAVLDWEMATIGDPLADVGLSLCYWTSGIAGGPDLSVPGWYTREQFVHEYALRTGRDVSAIRWYEILGIFKLAVILQQIYYRWKMGQTSDERFAALGAQVRELAGRAEV